jgi:GAF domain-containing protein
VIGKVVEQLLKEGREAIISRALKNSPLSALYESYEEPPEVRAILGGILEYVCGNRSEGTSLEAVQESAERFLDADIPWDLLSDLVAGLARSIDAYLCERGGEPESRTLFQKLIEVQAGLFDVYLKKEKEKREFIDVFQREIDRFPDTIAATFDPPTLAKLGLSRLKSMVGVESCTLFSVDGERRILPQFGDLVGAKPSPYPLVISGQAGRALFDQGEPYLEDTRERDSCLEDLKKTYDLRSVLLLPLVVRGRTVGVVVLSDGHRERRFTPEEIRIARSFCMRMAVAMENARLHSKEQHKIKETVALLEIARAVNSTLDLQEILDKVVQMTVDLCGVVMCVAFLLKEDKGIFVPCAYYGYVDDASWEEERAKGLKLASLGEEALQRLRRGEPVVWPCADKKPEEGLLIPNQTLYEHGVDLALVFPLCSKDKLTGLFSLYYPYKSGGLEREEMEVVGAIAAQASLAIENAALYEDIEKSYFSTVKALAKAIEVKDPYTHGHSERVTEYALMIAEAMELEDRDKQKLKYAATLHDIGKIGIAGKVLNKAGALTEEEYMHVKTHPLLGDSIIEPVEFLQGPRPIILHHHERFDGKGYPDGLKGTDIPLCARILAVADAFEAMRSDRPYRKALTLEEAREELIKNAGSPFDPEVVRIFLDILRKNRGDPINR